MQVRKRFDLTLWQTCECFQDELAAWRAKAWNLLTILRVWLSVEIIVVQAVSSGVTTKHWPQRQRTQGEAAGLQLGFVDSEYSQVIKKVGRTAILQCLASSFVCPLHQDLALLHPNFQMTCCECFDQINYLYFDWFYWFVPDCFAERCSCLSVMISHVQSHMSSAQEELDIWKPWQQQTRFHTLDILWSCGAAARATDGSMEKAIVFESVPDNLIQFLILLWISLKPSPKPILVWCFLPYKNLARFCAQFPHRLPKICNHRFHYEGELRRRFTTKLITANALLNLT